MAIKNGINPRFAELGKIKIGGKGKETTSANGKKFQLPVKYDHFVVTGIEKGADGNFIPDAEMMKKLGGKPREISVRLLFDDIDINFFTSFQLYSGAKLKCKGDGEFATRYLESGLTEIVECNPDKCEYALSDKCKISGILSCMISGQSQFGGVYRFRTHGWNSVSNILASLQFISQNNNGILAGLPMRLKMIKTVTAEHGTIDTVTLVIEANDIEEMRLLAYKESESRKLLNFDIKQIERIAIESGITKDNDDPADIEKEFYNSGVIPVSKGTSADDVVAVLESKSETVKPEKVAKADKQGGLDF